MIKLGNNDITLKVGSADVSAAYLGSTLVYSGGTPPTPPTPSFKWIATYTGGTTSTAECDSSSAITSGEIDVTDLVSVEIGDCVTSIGNQTFQRCTGLTSVTIPNNVTSIGNRAFYYCTNITSVTIGDNVTSIGEYAFRNCVEVTSITIYAPTPPSLGSRALEGTNGPIYVPGASLSAYKSAWSEYESRIQSVQSPQWVTFNSGDDISGLNIYGIKGNALDLSNNGVINLTGGIGNFSTIEFDFSRNVVNVSISDCYTDSVAPTDDVEYIFIDIGCYDYFTIDTGQTAGTTFQLYIYQ